MDKILLVETQKLEQQRRLDAKRQGAEHKRIIQSPWSSPQPCEQFQPPQWPALGQQPSWLNWPHKEEARKEEESMDCTE